MAWKARLVQLANGDSAPALMLGRAVGPFAACLDSELIRRYAAATCDGSAAVRAGSAVPAAAIVTQIWDAQTAGRLALVNERLMASASGGVHGSHDVVLHRPIEVGEPLQIWVEGHGARPAGRNSAVTLRYRALDRDGELVAEQWWTTILFGVSCEPIGEPPPDHVLAPEVRQRPVGTAILDIDEQMAQRYAEVSGDWSPHHFDPVAARRSGFDRIFLHGLCTMGLCANAAVSLVAGGDPRGVRRVAVRFATPTFIGEQVELAVYGAGGRTFAFEATSAGTTVISHGRIELT